MNVLILGGGARESALAWKITQSKHCNQLFVYPGNGGLEDYRPTEDLDLKNFSTIEAFASKYHIGCIVVGPEQPLVDGIADFFKDKKIHVFGPSQQAARLEGSKYFAKQFMIRHGIPTASAKKFDHGNVMEGIEFIRMQKPPIVLKADGLAAGKGVVIEKDVKRAIFSFEEMISGKFGEASKEVLIEQFLKGREFSVFALTDGKDYKILPVAKDYKRIGEGDTGLNTGGMGAVSPVSFVDSKLMRKVETQVIQPTIRGIQEEKLDYRGVIFFGLIEVEGNPYVIEYNCRFGDPETQVVLPRIESDLMELILACCETRLGQHEILIKDEACVNVVLASDGYPGPYEKGMPITIHSVVGNTLFFHAGTKVDQNQLVTSGGRVMSITSRASDFKKALEQSYEQIHHVHFDGKYFRKDIGQDL
jgi:phosphoribosylamine--glycine ligase